MQIVISKQYDEVKIFQDFKLELKEFAINVIVGPSGCGKSTLLQAIAGLIPYEGSTDFSGNIGYVFQEDRLFPYLTVWDNLRIISEDELHIQHLLTLFEIEHLKHHYPKKLSGGERQRVSLIRAFLIQNPVILMDEAFKSLDFDLKLRLMAVVLQTQKQFRPTIVLVTHDLDVALYLADVIFILSNKVTTVLDTIVNDSQGLLETNEKLRNQIKIAMMKGA
jgi:NitT/TauT family transport system ATP-binding protein